MEARGPGSRAQERLTLAYIAIFVLLTAVGGLGYFLWSAQNQLEASTNRLEVLTSQNRDLQTQQEKAEADLASERSANAFTQDFELSRLRQKIHQMDIALVKNSMKDIAVESLSKKLEKLKLEDAKLKEQLANSQKKVAFQEEKTPEATPSAQPTPKASATPSPTPATTSPAYQTASKWSRLETGMSKSQVREILGAPTATTTLGKGLEIWQYGFSSVSFESDHVTEWTKI